MDRLSPEGYRDQSTEQAVADTRACVEYIDAIDPAHDLITPIITPRFAPACTPATLHALGALSAETHLPIQTHISENTAELASVAALFPDSENYAHVYDAAGLLTPRTILAHAIHLSPAERALISARGAKVAHCPCSNTCLTSGAARVRELLDAGIEVGLGTDVSGGYGVSVLEQVRQAVMVSRHVAMGIDEDEEGERRERAKLATEEALYLATRGGAKVVGMDERIGGFEVGMEWDAQMIGLGVVPEDGLLNEDEAPVDLFGTEGWEEKVAKWVYNGDDRNTLAVWVKGRLVHRRKSYLP